MSFYKQVYHTLCEAGKQHKTSYLPKSCLHKHHIVPKHFGGTDDDSNLTYLDVRKHIIAHFLLWKINGNINDLRSMRMLGAKLSVEYRRKIGLYCVENKIGIHGLTKEQRLIYSNRGLETQRKSGSKKSFYYWSTHEGRKERASLGGKSSISSPKNPWSYWASEAGRKKRASLGGQSHKNKRAMYRPGDETFVRVPHDEIQKHLEEGYIFGSPKISKNKGKKTNLPSVRRKKVTDGITVFESLADAAIRHSVSISTIVYRCKSERNVNWRYVYENEP